MKFIITTGDCDHEGRPPRPSDKTIEIIFGNVWRGPRGDITDAEREAWNAKETPEGAQAKADSAQQAATSTAAEALKAHTDDSNIHKTSEQIRADIVEDDIPATIARTTDVETKDAETLAKAKEYTDGAVAAKADAQTVADALAGKVDKAEGKDLMTSAERNKLAGIEAGANAYTLPAANASALGGIKVGRNLSIDAEGRLSAIGGSGSGGGILVLPHVAPEWDADGNLTNSAAFVAAWGGIFSEYLAAPDSHALYMDTEAGEGLMLRIPCNVMNIGSDADMVQWLISGFTVVNVPMSSSEPVSCKATVMAAVICNAAGEMQSLAMYAGEGIAAADGKPNLLSADEAVIIDLGLDTGAMDEAKLKAAVQPVLAKLMTPTPPRVIVKCNAFYINGTFQTVGSQFIITAYGAHPYTVGDVNNTYIIRAGVIGTVVNGTITTVQGGYVGQELTTTEAMNAALAGKAALVPFSLTEQPVPGEFWDGKQVYIRTFVGTTPVESDGHSFRSMILEPAATACQFIRGSIGQMPPCYFGSSAGVNFNNNLYWIYDSVVGIGLRVLGPAAPITNPNGDTNNYMGGKSYRITFKYTKT